MASSVTLRGTTSTVDVRQRLVSLDKMARDATDAMRNLGEATRMTTQTMYALVISARLGEWHDERRARADFEADGGDVSEILAIEEMFGVHH